MPQAPTTTVSHQPSATLTSSSLLFSSISTPSSSLCLPAYPTLNSFSINSSIRENQETMTQNEELQGHVLVMAFPFGSHAAPLLNLVRRLAVLAPNVTFSFISTPNSNRTIFHSTSSTYESGLSNVKAYDVEDGIPEDHVPSRDPRVGMQFFLNSMAENFKKVINEKLMETKITCFLTDAFLWFAGDYAEEFAVPWISLWTAGPVSISSHFYTDLLRQTTALGEDGIAGREEEAITFIPGLQAIHLKDLPEGVITEPLGSPFSVMLHKMGQSLPRASAVIINSFEELDPPILDDLRSKLKKCLTVGPFTLTSPSASHLDPDGCLSWLDKQTPTSVAYISFGTVTTPPPHELVALAEALEESGTPFLWSIKDHLKPQLPEGFLERTSDRGKVIPWAPQEKVLDHSAVGVFVTHCGWNSILESIISGVPMICRPFFGDQRLNARMVSDVWKIGTTINDGVFTKDGTMKGLDLILYTRDGLKMRENIGGIRGLAKHAVGPKGSSSECFKTLFEIVCRK